MKERQQTLLYTVVIGLITFQISMIIYASATGWIRSRFDWIAYADDPAGFWNWFAFYFIGTLAGTIFLWALDRGLRQLRQ